MRNKALLLLLSLLISACSSYQDLGEWQVLTEDMASEQLGEKFGVPKPNDVLEGLTFWQISPLISQASYAFQWREDSIDLWLPNGDKITKHQLIVSDCVALDEQLDVLLDAIAESASTMFAGRERNSDVIFVGSPIVYQVKYYPPNAIESIVLRNIEYFKAPWITEVKKTQDILESCLKPNL